MSEQELEFMFEAQQLGNAAEVVNVPPNQKLNLTLEPPVALLPQIARRLKRRVTWRYTPYICAL